MVVEVTLGWGRCVILVLGEDHQAPEQLCLLQVPKMTKTKRMKVETRARVGLLVVRGGE